MSQQTTIETMIGTLLERRTGLAEALEKHVAISNQRLGFLNGQISEIDAMINLLTSLATDDSHNGTDSISPT